MAVVAKNLSKVQSEVNSGTLSYPSVSFSAFLNAAKTRSQLDLQQLTLVLIFLVSIAVFLLQFVFRELDDNRLLSWRWTVTGDNVWRIALLAMGFIAVASVFMTRVKNERIILLVLVSFAFFMSSLLWYSPQLIIDSARYVNYANIIQSHGILHFVQQWGTQVAPWTDLPLIPAFFGLVFAWFGESALLLQVLSTLFYSATVLLVYCLGRALWSREIGLYAAALLLAFPFLSAQSSQILVDVPSMFLFTLALWLSLRAVQNPGVLRVALAVVAAMLTLLSKYTGWVLFGAIALLPLLVSFNGYPGNVRTSTKTSIKAAGGIFVISAVLLLGMVGMYYSVFLSQFELLRSFQMPGLSWWGESHVSTFFFQIHPFVSLAAIAAFVIGIYRRDTTVLVVASIFVLLMAVGVHRARYYVIFYPLLALLAAFGLKHLFNKKASQMIILCAVAFSFSLSSLANSAMLRNTSMSNLELAGTYLNSLKEDTIAVLVLPQQESLVNPQISIPILDLYTRKNLLLVENNTSSYQQVPEAIQRSPIRFTWEYDPGSSYQSIRLAELSKQACGDFPVVVMASRPNQWQSVWGDLPRNYVKTKEFVIQDKMFRYQTLLTIFRVEKCNNSR